ncbi:MAG: hypothetical protein V1724_01180, partial [Chloroflexota bacterium]
EDEAKRLATTIRVLVHDTKSMRSLLGQLNMKDSIQIHSTAHPFNPMNLLPHQGLVMMRVEAAEGAGAAVTFTLLGEDEPYADAPLDKPRAKMTYIPRCSGPEGSGPKPTKSPFNKWWGEVVIKDKDGRRFTRRDLVLGLADKEGGTHVDPTLDKEYAMLSRFNSQGWRVNTWGIVQPPDNSLVAASVRQIAYEVLLSIEQAFPGLCGQPN